jgi:predicted PurR-regulated permease PerM
VQRARAGDDRSAGQRWSGARAAGDDGASRDADATGALRGGDATGVVSRGADVASAAATEVDVAEAGVTGAADAAGAGRGPGGANGGRGAGPARDDHAVPRGLRIAAAWAWRVLLLVIAGWAVLWVIGKLSLVAISLAIALLLSALLSPAVGALTRLRVPRSLASAIVLVGGLAAVVGTLTLVINQFVDGAPELVAKATAGIRRIQESVQQGQGPFRLSEEQLQEISDTITGWFTNGQSSWAAGAISTASTVGHFVTGLFLVLFTTFFFLRDGRKITRFLFGMLPRPVRSSLLSAADASWATLVSYVRATVLVAFIDAAGIGLALVILDVPFAFALAALVFLSSFIPIVGATVSGAVAVLVALVDQGLVVALILLAAVIAVQQVEGHLLQPLIMGRAVAIHPLAVIVAIAVGSLLAGIVGALLAVPVVAVLNTGIRHLAELREAAEEGRPPRPVEPTGPPMPGGAQGWAETT